MTQSSLLTITGSLNVLDKAGSGPGEIDITGPGAELNFESSMTLDGTGGNLLINIGTSAAQSEFLSIGSSDILTLGTAVSLNQTAAGSSVRIDDVSVQGTLVNAGTMTFAAGAGSSAIINPDRVVNLGTINESGGLLGGESLDISAQTSFSQAATGKIELTNFGRIGISASIAAGDFILNGGIDISGQSTLDLNTNASGNGLISISTSSTADIFNYTGTVAFLDPTGTLKLEQPGSFTGLVAGMSAPTPLTFDTIDLLNTQATSFAPYSGTVLDGTVTVMNGIDVVASIHLLGDYTNQTFNMTSDGNSGTNIFLVSCFAAGTRIATPAGEVAVEDLRPSDLVMTAGGGQAPVIWIGHRHIDCRRHARPERVWPVCVRAGAFGPNTPHRDLVLSPDHAVFIDDVLIPVGRLVNGTSILHLLVDSVTYYHVELPRHDLLLAEGLAVESWLDVGDRGNFANAPGVTRLFPDFAPRAPGVAGVWEAYGRAPLVVAGPRLEAARQAIVAHAATPERRRQA